MKSGTNAEVSTKSKPAQAFNAQARLGIMDSELDEDSKQQIHSKLKARSQCEGEQLVAIDEEGKLFSVDDDGELYYVATLDAPAIATVIDAGRRREKST